MSELLHVSDAPALDEDLPCPECRYNLRGLSGDPVRCPECFRQTPVAELRKWVREHTMSEFERARRALEAAGNTCAVAVVPAVVSVVAQLRGDHSTRQWLLPLGVTSVVVWFAGAAVFAARARFLRGWLGALLWYHVAGVAAMTANLVLCIAGIVLLSACTVYVEIPILAIPILLGVPFLVLWKNPMRWLSRLGRARLDVLAEKLTRLRT